MSHLRSIPFDAAYPMITVPFSGETIEDVGVSVKAVMKHPFDMLEFQAGTFNGVINFTQLWDVCYSYDYDSPESPHNAGHDARPTRRHAGIGRTRIPRRYARIYNRRNQEHGRHGSSIHAGTRPYQCDYPTSRHGRQRTAAPRKHIPFAAALCRCRYGNGHPAGQCCPQSRAD